MVVGYFIGSIYERGILVQNLNMIKPIREHNPEYKFISPLLAYVIPSAEQSDNLISLKNNISNFINAKKVKGDLTDASLFFYDLNRGRWIGVNEQQKYSPASMLKVVIMVSYFKKAETNPNILNESLAYTNTVDDLIKKDSFNALSGLKINKSYSILQLIEKMIIDSDNGAEILLLQNIDKSSLDSIYSVLNIDNPDDAIESFVISPRTYSLFFRIIYSATYLNREMSERALDILSKTNFNEGITAGLPTNIITAHKFGEYVTVTGNELRSVELHDCGIVYYPTNPYFVCIMTKGGDINKLKAAIKNISNLVYQNYGSLK